MIAPRYQTPRTPGRPTDGALGAFIAHLHGRPWHDHQRAAADLAGEQLDTGRYAYSTFVMTFPRQCGKTTVDHDTMLGRALQYRDYRAAYAAQTGHKTTERFAERIEEIESGPLARRVKTRRSGGTERLTLARSYLKAFPPKAGALRSDALDAVTVDEAQEHDDALGAQLDLTIVPTFSTRPRRQLWIVATAGTDASGYLRRHRAAALAGAPGYAIIEYGAPDGADTDDEAMWPLWHPGLAAGLTDLDALRQARIALGAAGFAREYLNVWTRTAHHTIEPEAWQRTTAHQLPMPPGRLALGVDVSLDGASYAVALAGPHGHLELIESGPYRLGAAAARVHQLATRYAALVGIDRRPGPASPLADKLELGRCPGLSPMSVVDVANGAATFADDVHAGALTVWPHPDLDHAVAIAVPGNTGDGGWTFSRTRSAGNIAPLVAAAAARWALLRDPGPPSAPHVDAG